MLPWPALKSHLNSKAIANSNRKPGPNAVDTRHFTFIIGTTDSKALFSPFLDLDFNFSTGFEYFVLPILNFDAPSFSRENYEKLTVDMISARILRLFSPFLGFNVSSGLDSY